MIGIYVWAILIFIIAVYCCPGFLSMLAIILGSVVAVYLVGYSLLSWLRWVFGSENGKEKAINGLEQYGKVFNKRLMEEKEKAINEWEKKWGRTHPSRKK